MEIKKISANDPHYKHWPQEEKTAYWDFIKWYIQQDHLALMSVPKPPTEYEFWPFEFDEEGNAIAIKMYDADGNPME